jgi:hypothetical protein
MGHKQLFETTGALANADVPHDVRSLAGALSQLHGDVSLAQEARGIHLYLACPDCLENDGDKELRARHLAVNADRYTGSGSWAGLIGTYDMERSCMCMKTEKTYLVATLTLPKPKPYQCTDMQDGERCFMRSSFQNYH